jgi:predicted ribosomally synthesized peptide with nif11-like leader
LFTALPNFCHKLLPVTHLLEITSLTIFQHLFSAEQVRIAKSTCMILLELVCVGCSMVNNAVAFLQKVDRDTHLQTLINAADWEPQAITRLAISQGFAFSVRELLAAMDTLWGSLSEEDLSSISGGFKHDNPPPGQDGGNKGGTWSPPPGDVSGNSCFFGWKGGK